MADPEMTAHWRRCEAAGLPSVFQLSESGQYRTSRIPLVDKAVSYTMSGQPAVSRRLSDAVTVSNIGSLLIFHYPSIWNHVLGDHAVSFQVLPIGPMQTQVRTKWLVHKDAIEGKDYSLDELTHVWLATNNQDRRVVEENQIGIRSPVYEPGPYSADHEGGVMQFVDWYCRTMQRSLGGERANLSRVA
jgi:Rieske 2Fe-2S family protein